MFSIVFYIYDVDRRRVENVYTQKFVSPNNIIVSRYACVNLFMVCWYSYDNFTITCRWSNLNLVFSLPIDSLLFSIVFHLVFIFF